MISFIIKEDNDMSNNNRDYNNNRQTTNETQENATERVPYTLDVTPSNFEDRATGLSDQMTSYELLSIVNNIFKVGFEDYEGSKFILDSHGIPVIELWFNHRVPQGADVIVGFSQNIEGEKYKNKTTARVMRQNRAYREGYTYNITQDAKDVIGKYIMPQYKSKNGKINWDQITGDIANQSSNGFVYGAKEVMSRVYGIAPEEILRAKFGSKNAKGENVQYGVAILNSLPSSSGTPGFLLSVTQVNEVQFDRALRNAGIVNPNGLGIYKN